MGHYLPSLQGVCAMRPQLHKAPRLPSVTGMMRVRSDQSRWVARARAERSRSVSVRSDRHRPVLITVPENGT